MQITKIDLTQDGEHGVLVKEWNEGWTEGSREDTFHYEPGKNVFRLLTALEAQGYTVEMCDQTHGRALRGKITRIDFEIKPDRVHVKKYPFGWTAKTRPIKQYEITPEEYQADLKWLKDHGWSMREWPGGSRAFKGDPLPVRTGSTIAYMRRQVERHFASGQLDPRRQFDLAFDF